MAAPPTVLKEGWLLKLGGQVKKWKQRYFRVAENSNETQTEEAGREEEEGGGRGGVLRYYKDETCRILKGEVALQGCKLLDRSARCPANP